MVSLYGNGKHISKILSAILFDIEEDYGKSIAKEIKMMPKIPYGISSFARLRRDDYIYIDKTRYIEVLESYGEPYIFLLRPRRFGKTLFLSTLKCYYDINERDNFNQLFGDLYIGRNKTKLASSYYILEFDFSGVTTVSRAKMKELFTQKIRGGIRSFIEKYGFLIKVSDSDEPAGIIHDFNVDLTNILKDHKIYLLIDEYDHFANAILAKQWDEFQGVVGERGFVRLFFEALKESTASKEIISRMFVTGVSPITLDSMTSGFNIESNLTTDFNFNEVMGFTVEEIEPLIDGIAKSSKQRRDLLKRLYDYYNGYRFSKSANTRVFNSDMILYFFNSYQKWGREPDSLVDKSISSDYATLQNLFGLKNREENYAILEDILAGHKQKGKITEEFNLLGRFSKKDFISLLFYLGFLTIDGEADGFIYFDVPNYAIKEIYFDFFMEVISEELVVDTIDVESTVVDLLKNGEISSFIEKIEDFLTRLSNRDQIRFDEKYIKVVMLAYISLSSLCIAKSEYEVEGGYIDIAILRRGEGSNYEALLEVKYIKKSDLDIHGERVVQKKRRQAKEQLFRYGNTEEFKDRQNLKKWAIVFAGPKAVVVEEVSS